MCELLHIGTKNTDRPANRYCVAMTFPRAALLAIESLQECPCLSDRAKMTLCLSLGSHFADSGPKSGVEHKSGVEQVLIGR
jgi:hypothetical protein